MKNVPKAEPSVTAIAIQTRFPPRAIPTTPVARVLTRWFEITGSVTDATEQRSGNLRKRNQCRTLATASVCRLVQALGTSPSAFYESGAVFPAFGTRNL